MAKATAAPGARRLVIVESPAKAKTIEGYLPAGFHVEASVGHIRDLPQPSELPAEMKKGPFGRFAVNVDDGFEPYYVVDADKKKKVSELKKLLRESDELYLATDEDREGEAIAWHLLQALEPRVPVHRMVFHEITPEAIERALGNLRGIDERLVDAQETRRILDRLYGYEVSPVLWRKVRAGLSAGRVQSVATRLVVERERERMVFKAAQYWDLTGQFTPVSGDQTRFVAKLVSVDDVKIAQGRDFDDSGALVSPGALVLTGEMAVASAEALAGAAFAVQRVDTKPYRRRPAAPFTTSTLQQEASRKLRFSAKQTMRTAQSLYERGYITYMRTDSTALSEQAVAAARQQARGLYGAASVPDQPRVYSKKSKNAQEAHEAVRPAGDSFRTPSAVSGELRSDELALYDLIWKRTVASQMADATGSTATIRLAAQVAPISGVGSEFVFSASGTVITFRGFLAAYEEGRDEQRNGSDDGKDKRLPDVAAGDELAASDIESESHQTNPPPRYTEASLVKALEERGIGRPSTYAATISTIVDRGYVGHRGNALVPSWLAFAVTRLLEEHFGQLVDYQFTASMEADLDRIAGGEQDRAQWLARFYFGEGVDGGVGHNGGVPENDGHAVGAVADVAGLKDLVENMGEIDARGISTVPIGEGIVLRVGRYGPYLERPGQDDQPERASVPEDIAPDELTTQRAQELFETHGEADRELGVDPATGYTVVAKNGRFGPYVTEVLPEELTSGKKKVKPRTGSLFKSMTLADVTLADALRLMGLPRVVGADPENGDEITAQNGRYGPYLRKGKDSRSLESEDQIFEVTLEEALKLYAQPKRGRTAKPPLRELGKDPATELDVVVKDGRFGPYVTDGESNATLRGADTPESVTLERAAELLADRRANAPKKAAKKAAKKAPAKKAAKKAPAKKAAKKAPAKKAAKKAPAKKAAKKAPAKKAAKKAPAKKAAKKAPAKKAAKPDVE